MHQNEIGKRHSVLQMVSCPLKSAQAANSAALPRQHAPAQEESESAQAQMQQPHNAFKWLAHIHRKVLEVCKHVKRNQQCKKSPPVLTIV
jgi:hypothetical protein